MIRSAAGTRFTGTRALRIILSSLALAFLLFLPFAGRFLHQQDPLERADLIFVLAGGRAERWLEGVELYKEGWAPRIVLSPGPSGPLEAELRQKGIAYPREGDLTRDAVVASGVPADAVTVLPDWVDNTAHEAVALARALRQTPVRRVIVVTSPYHTRRTGFAFRRALGDAGIDVRVRSTRFSDAQPARWWRRRADVRYVVSELPKLALYAIGVRE